MDKKGWIFIALALAAMIFVFSLPPLHDSPSITIYADQRSFWGIPNFNDVISNIPFIILGFMGLARIHRGLEQGLWILFFGAVVGVGLGQVIII